MSIVPIVLDPRTAWLPLPTGMNLLRHQRNLARLIARHEAAPEGTHDVDGLRLAVRRGMFNPAFGSFSRILGGVVAARVRSGYRVLDLGTGSGYLGIIAASRGASVLATEVDASLAPLVARNSAANRVSMEFRATGDGTLFGAIAADEQFDTIVANLPFSRELLVRRWKAMPYFNCFAAPQGLVGELVRGAMRHLRPGGELLFCYGSSGWMDELADSLRAARAELHTHWLDQTPTGSEWRFVIGVRQTEWPVS